MSIELRQALERVAARIRRIRLWSALTLCWLAWGLIGSALLSLSSGSEAIGPVWLVLTGFFVLAAMAGLACAAWALRSTRDRRGVARRIEAKHPELGTGLLAAVEEDAGANGRFSFLQTSVIRAALEHRRTHDWEATVPDWKLNGMRLAHAASLAFLLVVSFGLASEARSRRDGALSREPGLSDIDLEVDPGNTEIERGTPLLVVARFKGMVPAEAMLVVDDAGDGEIRSSMTRSLEDPAFAGRVASVESDLAYHVEYGGRKSEVYRVTTFEYPAVVRTDAVLSFPSYTSLEPKIVEDVRHVTAVEGADLTLICRLNKEVATARLIDEQNGTIELLRDPADERAYRATFKLTDPRRFHIELLDREGRSNKTPTEIAVNVVRNRPAVVTSTRPSRDVRVSPVEELSIAAKLEDDFGVVRHGVSYALAGAEPNEVVLAGEPNGRRLDARHLLDFESFDAKPDQLVAYHFWAEDVGSDGLPRRSSGDMFFAEVRAFEEIFREGRQPAGGQQQGGGQQGRAAQQAMQLLELQKEIINGTWKLIRRETGSTPTAEFAADGKLLQESQQAAIDQATAAAEQFADPASQTELADAKKFMTDAVTHLGRSSVSSLQPALVAEQAAYQALLKLRDREFNVIRGNQQQQGGGGGGGPSQQQLQQLELSNEENRYEERRSANADELSEQDQAQREMRQVLNRLRELARRQEDLNERLKELQSALEAAKDEEQREEVQRQLKRLREQQQQVLRDTDELRERMESEENRDRMADARQQVEESREHVRQASEALEEGRTSQALTEGTRAGRQFEELSDELRKQASNHFSEEMTEMRDEARRLDEQQQQLSERLESLDDGSQRSLRDTEERQGIREGLDGQKQQLDELLERMRRTVQEAEESEPMLAEKLYDTVRETERRSISEALDAADRLTDLGISEEAARVSRQAGDGIDDLRKGVEAAAESVLGDETAALRRAQGELEDLADQIDRELGDPDGKESPDTGEGSAETDRGAAAESNGRGPEEGKPDDPSGSGDPNASAGQEERDDAESRREDVPGEEPGSTAKSQNQGPGGSEAGARETQPDREGGRSPSEQQSGEPSQERSQGVGTGQAGREPGSEQGEPQESGEPGGARSEGRGSARPSPSSNEGSNSLRGGGDDREPTENTSANGGRNPSELERLLDQGAGPSRPGGPITGDGFREWSDRMRDVEELLEDPEWRAEAARIRDRARGAREEFKRHSKEPNPTALRNLVAEPLRELRDRVAEEIRRRESPDSLVPIDRDPVPPAYAEGVRRYYERLGIGR